jgi:hypothetical protein
MYSITTLPTASEYVFMQSDLNWLIKRVEHAVTTPNKTQLFFNCASICFCFSVNCFCLAGLSVAPLFVADTDGAAGVGVGLLLAFDEGAGAGFEKLAIPGVCG